MNERVKFWYEKSGNTLCLTTHSAPFFPDEHVFSFLKRTFLDDEKNHSATRAQHHDNHVNLA